MKGHEIGRNDKTDGMNGMIGDVLKKDYGLR